MARSQAFCSSVVQGVQEQASKTPAAVAVQDGDERLSYQDLDRRSNHLGFFLQAMGVKAKVPVAICLPRSLDMTVAVLGILKAGGAYLPLDPHMPAERLAIMVDESRPAVVLAHSQTVASLPGVSVPVVLLDADGTRSERADPPSSHTGPDDSAYIIYTSAGRPKGVAMGQRALLHRLSWQVAHSACGVGDRTLQLAPLFSDLSFQEIFATWYSGGTLVLADEEARTDPARLLEQLVTADVRRLFLPFAALQQMAEVAIQRGPLPLGLREVVTAGEALRITRAIADLLAQLPLCTLENQYGPLSDGLSSLGPLTDHSLEQQEPEPPTAAVLAESPVPERGAADIPVTGARLGRDANGTPAWCVADPLRAGKTMRVEVK